MRSIRIPCAALAAVALLGHTAPAAAADDDIRITGCVVRNAGPRVTAERSLLVWSKGDVMLADASARLEGRAVGTSGAIGNVLYWIDDNDDLAKHAGRRVEIVGEVRNELNRGEVEIDRKDDFTEIEFEWEGRDVRARVPNWMLGTVQDDAEFDVVVRRVDVEDVHVITGGAPCP